MAAPHDADVVNLSKYISGMTSGNGPSEPILREMLAHPVPEMNIMLDDGPMLALKSPNRNSSQGVSLRWRDHMVYNTLANLLADGQLRSKNVMDATEEFNKHPALMKIEHADFTVTELTSTIQALQDVFGRSPCVLLHNDIVYVIKASAAAVNSATAQQASAPSSHTGAPSGQSPASGGQTGAPASENVGDIEEGVTRDEDERHGLGPAGGNQGGLEHQSA